RARRRAALRQRGGGGAGHQPGKQCFPDHQSSPTISGRIALVSQLSPETGAGPDPASAREGERPGQPGLLPYVLDRLAAALLVSAPPRAHPVGAADEDRLDPADVLAVDLEQLAELPAPVDRPVVEEGEREHYPALAVDRDVAAVANPGHRADQRGLELLL